MSIDDHRAVNGDEDFSPSLKGLEESCPFSTLGSGLRASCMLFH